MAFNVKVGFMDKEEKAQALEVLEKLAAYLRSENEDEPTEKIWTDFWEMAKDIKEHAMANGQAIIQYDRPKQLQIGYKCANTGKTWHIRIASLRKALQANEETDATLDSEQNKKDELLKRAVQTCSGKEALLIALNGK